MSDAAIYTRISRDSEGTGLGVERQEQDCRQLATRLGLTVVTVYCDNDAGASTLSKKKRPQYEKMMAAAEQPGGLAAIVAYSNSRLTRRPLQLERLIAAHDKTGVRLHTVVSGDDDLSTADGRMVARIKASVDAAESERTGERIRRQKAQLAASGKWPGGRRPYGYEPGGEKVRPSEAEVVARAADAILHGGSLRGEVARLNTAGATTSTGKAWTAKELRMVLLRPRNAGLREHQGVVVGKAVWEPLIGEETWHALVEVLTDPARRTSYTTARKWLLSNLAMCGVCGAPMRVTLLASSRANVPAYSCSAGKCVVRNAHAVDELVEAFVVEWLLLPGSAELLRPRRPGVDRAGLSAEIEALRTRLDALADNVGLDERTLARRGAALTRRMDVLTSQLRRSVPGESPLCGVVDAADPVRVWQALDLDRKRAIIRVLMTVTVDRAVKGRRRGWRAGESYFDPESVRIEPRIVSG